MHACLRSKRFRLVSEQKKPEEWDFGFCSFTCAIFRAVFVSCSLFFAPKLHRNACYADLLRRLAEADSNGWRLWFLKTC